MTDQELKDLVASLAIRSAKLDEQLDKLREESLKTDEQMRKTDEKLERMGITLGNISNNQGAVAEEFFFNSLKATQILAGIHYDSIDKNLTRAANGTEDEFDIVMINGKDVAIVEVKYKAHESDLTKLLTKKYENFKKLFPIYKDYTHHLVLATFSLYDELKEAALSNGVIVLQRKGDTIESFVPAA
jgi:Holliday junction resolvase-like predicted endonuclease